MRAGRQGRSTRAGSRSATGSAKTGKRLALGWALLGLIIERPGDGHELAGRFEDAYGDALSLSSTSQVYRALDSLRSRSLIEEVSEEHGDSASRQQKLRYGATIKGVQAYQQWLISQAQERPRSSRLLTQQIASLRPEDALRVLESFELQCLEQAQQSSKPPPGQSDGDAWAVLAKRLVSEQERLALNATLNWLEYAKHELQAGTAGT